MFILAIMVLTMVKAISATTTPIQVDQSKIEYTQTDQFKVKTFNLSIKTEPDNPFGMYRAASAHTFERYTEVVLAMERTLSNLFIITETVWPGLVTPELIRSKTNGSSDHDRMMHSTRNNGPNFMDRSRMNLYIAQHHINILQTHERKLRKLKDAKKQFGEDEDMKLEVLDSAFESVRLLIRATDDVRHANYETLRNISFDESLTEVERFAAYRLLGAVHEMMIETFTNAIRYNEQTLQEWLLGVSHAYGIFRPGVIYIDMCKEGMMHDVRRKLMSRCRQRLRIIDFVH